MRTTMLGEPVEERRREMAHQVAAMVGVGVRTRAVLEATPRHLLVPGRSVQDAYGQRPIVVKADEGKVVCSTTEPAVQAQLLELAQIGLGQRVLLVGAAPGITAAMTEQLVGPRGQVVALETDPDLARRTQLALVATGYHRTHLVMGDATSEHPFRDGEFDRIVATGSLAGIPAWWWRWLRPGGRLVVPLRVHGHCRIIAFVHEGDRLVGEDWISSEVPALRWPDQPGGGVDHMVPLGGGCTLHLGHQQSEMAPVALAAAADPGPVRWSRVTIPAVRCLDDLALTLARDGAAIGRVTGPGPGPAGTGSPALVDSGRLAVVVYRPAPGPASTAGPRWQLGTAAYGGGEGLAPDLLTWAGAWAARPHHRPVFHAYPAGTSPGRMSPGTPLADLPGARLQLTR
ncbi:methyltransferase domain-containing protein [Kitasatospora sp. NPDC051853]|uniref:methyltransferase domain-containing protein n=1 Tax=Kitasatospora sp. NPDC051853 TaxID=3364058 RepID=UPI0037919F89